MSNLINKFKSGARKASVQATSFVMDSSTKVASGSRDFMHGFTLPGEAEKAAKILSSFLGNLWALLMVCWRYRIR
jgi:SH3 domain-containing YSC84-like protein 1